MIIAQREMTEPGRENQASHSPQQSRKQRPRAYEFYVERQRLLLAALLQFGQMAHGAESNAEVGRIPNEFGRAVI